MKTLTDLPVSSQKAELSITVRNNMKRFDTVQKNINKKNINVKILTE